MKKIIAPTLCTLILCSLILISVGPNIAVAQVYQRTSYPTQVIPTIDGKWTSDDEWTDGEFTWIGTDVAFTSTWDNPGDDVYTRWLVEFLTDTTDDPGDYWMFCIDRTQNGGSSPQLSYHHKLEIYGHTNMIWYMGTEQGDWQDLGGVPDNVEWANSFSASPTSDTPHWILEFQIAKNAEGGATIVLDILWNFLLGVNDQSNPGFKSWPPDASPDAPDEWGAESYSTEPIPEGLTFAVMALLTTISMLVGYKYFIKRKETKTK